VKPVMNHGFKPDGSGSTQDVLYFLILKALEEEK